MFCVFWLLVAFLLADVLFLDVPLLEVLFAEALLVEVLFAVVLLVESPLAEPLADVVLALARLACSRRGQRLLG